MTKIYLAARYSRNDEMRGVRDVLEAFGHQVTSRWIDLHGGKYPASFTPEQLNDDPGYCGTVAVHDFEDVRAADTVISFTEPGGGGKGGRHVEFGLALGLGKRLIIVAPREHVFHAWPDAEWYPDWSRLVMALGQELGWLSSAGGTIATSAKAFPAAASCAWDDPHDPHLVLESGLRCPGVRS